MADGAVPRVGEGVDGSKSDFAKCSENCFKSRKCMSVGAIRLMSVKPQPSKQ